MSAAPPRLVALEVTTRCNLRCVMCPHGLGAMTDARDADLALVEAVWPAMQAASVAHLNGVGEPLLADVFWMLIDRLSGRQTPLVDFNTNGLLLSETNIARLAKAPIGALNVSVDAATERTYRRIRGGSFAKLREGVRDLASSLAGRSELSLNFVVMRENFDEMVPFVVLAHELGIGSVWFGPLTEPSIPADGWVVARDDGWRFDYRAQRISGADPRLIARLDQAEAKGRELGVSVRSGNIGKWALA